jgi:phosphoadenosine phosphosulfate reductase
MIACINEHNVAYNTLHDKGFIRIGCAPCTRAIGQGEDTRAGRWWLEASQKECGIACPEPLKGEYYSTLFYIKI